MIKFFREIRQKLLSENKFSKYLLYAIGEIMLVVIGILLALNINNRNEEKKFKKEVIDQLVILSKELEYDINEYNILFNYIPEDIDYVKKLSHGRYDDLDLKDFLYPVATNFPSIPTAEAYNRLKEIAGLNIIDDPVLTNKLSNYYNFRRKRYIEMQQYDANMTWRYIEPKLLDILEWNNNNELIEENIKKIIQDKTLNSIYNQRLDVLEMGYAEVSYNLVEAEELKEVIANYIAKNTPNTSGNISDANREKFKEIELSQDKLGKFAGIYIRSSDTLSIIHEQKQLFVQTKRGRRIELFPYTEDKLFIKSFYDQMNFKKEDGEFVGFMRMQTYSFFRKQEHN